MALEKTSPKDSRTVIDVQNVTVAYRSYRDRPTSIKENVLRFMKTGKWSSYATFKALSDVSFHVNQGEVIGIVGSNGSGKSTLLKVLAQVLKPTSGKAVLNGSVMSLIELGVGFDPELNAIENIMLSGALHRKPKNEVKKRIDHILEFSELGEFATTPIKYYSSGMGARLGFAVAVDFDPDILLIDEILGVGDERFQKKCSEVFERFFRGGKTIILVSHDLNMLENTAHRVLLLSKGELVFSGDPSTAIHLYRDSGYKTALQ